MRVGSGRRYELVGVKGTAELVQLAPTFQSLDHDEI